MPKTQTDYSNTIIYKLCCKDSNVNDMYIGHTTNFIQRKNQHKTCCINENYKKYNQYNYHFIREHGGWDNWTMIQIENISCKNKREAEATEHFWIEKLHPTLNTNKPYAKCKEELQIYKHCWYEEKKDYILDKSKQYYEENKEQKIKYQKQYAQEHKEQLAECKKLYREKNKEKLSEQQKIYREEHKEEAQKAHKEWREANKEKLKFQKGQVIECECGHAYTFGNKHRHLQSKIHTLYQTSIMNPKSEEELKIIEDENKSKQKEQQKKYRDNHKEQIQECKKQHYQHNKEQILEQNKQYKEEHKDQNKKYIEENKEKIQNYKNDWYLKNKEKILQKQKEMVICDCGAEIRKSGRAEHCRSKKHQDYMTIDK